MIKLTYFKLADASCGHRGSQSLPESPGGDSSRKGSWPADSPLQPGFLDGSEESSCNGTRENDLQGLEILLTGELHAMTERHKETNDIQYSWAQTGYLHRNNKPQPQAHGKRL